MDRTTRRRLVAVAVLGVATALGASAVTTASADATLVVADADSGDRLLAVPVDDGTEVTLAYTHSVEKTPIEDVYVVDGTRLRMTHTVFHSHGAGLPSDAPIERTDEGFVLAVDRTYDELGVVPGSVAGHELVVGDERYDLVERADGAVTISVTDRSLSEAIPGIDGPISASTSVLDEPVSALDRPISAGDRPASEPSSAAAALDRPASETTLAVERAQPPTGLPGTEAADDRDERGDLEPTDGGRVTAASTATWRPSRA